MDDPIPPPRGADDAARVKGGARAPFARGFDMTIDSLLGSTDCTNLAASSACMASSSAAGCRAMPAAASLAFFRTTTSSEAPHRNANGLPKSLSSPLGTRFGAPAARASSPGAGSAMPQGGRVASVLTGNNYSHSPAPGSSESKIGPWRVGGVEGEGRREK
jgi:hypothetical protein